MKAPKFLTTIAILSAALLCCGCVPSFEAALARTLLKKRALTLQKIEGEMLDKTDQGTISLPENVRFPRPFTESRYEGMQVFEMAPADDTKPVLFYLHGGAYIHNFDKNHWKSMADIAKQTGCGVVAPNYPILPLHTAAEAHRLVLGLYASLLNRIPADRIVLSGDSAGGGFALALAQEARDAGLPVPGRLILISPFVDVCGGDESLQDKDTWLHVDACRACGRYWAGELDVKDPRVSPLYGDMHGLPPTDLYSGTYDVLYPDVVKTAQKLQEAGVDTRLHIAEKFGHVYPLYPVHEGKKARREISRIILSK